MARKKDLPSAVTAALAQALGTAEIDARILATGHVPGLGEVRLVTANPTGRHNERHAVTVDEAGTVRGRAEIAAMAGRDPFVPVFPTGAALVPAALVPLPPVSIDPPRNDLTLNKCQTLTETITVTVPPTGVKPKADVYLLADTTGSMSDVLAAVQASGTAILNDPAFAAFDVAWGVGNYRDFPVDGVKNSYAFRHQQSLTTVVADAVTAIGAWVSGEGSDISEGQLYALDQVANDPAIGWRPDAKRIVVWIGDAPGHDPICASLTGLGSDLTEATTTATLTAAGITVVAIGTDTGVVGDLDADPNADAGDYSGAGCAPAGTAGQATRITAATGGSYTSGLSAADVVAKLVDLIKKAVTSIGNVRLVATGATAEFVLSISPAGGYGPLPGDTEHVLTFDVVWRGTRDCARAAQEFTGALDVIADGAVVASKPVRVTVPACRHHYPVTFVCGPQRPGDKCLTVEPGNYATLVTLYNPGTCPVVVEKRFAPIAINGDVFAREPKTSRARPFAKIEIGPGEVTIDDCCALGEAVGDVESLIGVLDLVASSPLEVTVTTTVAGHCPPKGGDDGGDDGDHHDSGHDDGGDGHDDGDGHDGGSAARSCCAPSITSRTIEARMAP